MRRTPHQPRPSKRLRPRRHAALQVEALEARAVPTVITIGPSKDNTLYQSDTGSLSNGAGPSFFVGTTAGSLIRRGVIAFDIAGSVPAGATINTVALRLNMSMTLAAAQPVELHRLLADWGEGTSVAPGGGGGGAPATTNDATWIHRFFNTVTWTNPGGDFSPSVSARTTVGAPGSYVWGSTPEMVADVQGWLNNPGSNFGWLLLGNEATSQTAKRFDSKENPTPSSRPTLTIDYTAAPDTLRVTSFAGSPNGFTATFNRALAPGDLNLYDAASDGLGPTDVTLIGAATGAVQGSLVVNAAATSITFLTTGGPLPADTYAVRLRSAANGFHTPAGDLLDGNGDGTPGDNYVNTFVVPPSSAPVVSVPDFARGPGQSVNVPADGSGLPLTLSNGAGVTSVTLTLLYDPALLRLTGVTPLAGATASLDTTTPGRAVLTFSSPTPLSAGPVEFARLTAAVPDTAPYTSKQVLDLTNVQVNGAAARDDDGLMVVGYFGDTSGNGGYSAIDAQRALRVAVGLDSGFGAYQLADPLITADITGNGIITSTDATRILQAALGIPVAQIPALPTMPPTIVPGGPDPRLSIPKHFRARPGGIVTVPVRTDFSEGLESADLALSFDAARLEVVSVRRGRLTRDFDLFATNVDADAGTIRAGLGRSAGPIHKRGAGSLLVITFRVKAEAPAGPVVINLRQGTQLNEGGLTLTPAPSDEAGDALDGRLLILRRGRRSR